MSPKKGNALRILVAWHRPTAPASKGACRPASVAALSSDRLGFSARPNKLEQAAQPNLAISATPAAPGYSAGRHQQVRRNLFVDPSNGCNVSAIPLCRSPGERRSHVPNLRRALFFLKSAEGCCVARCPAPWIRGCVRRRASKSKLGSVCRPHARAVSRSMGAGQNPPPAKLRLSGQPASACAT